ncbi:MAG: hypothetical protein ACOYJD_04115 [Christensenellales bacterium]
MSKEKVTREKVRSAVSELDDETFVKTTETWPVEITSIYEAPPSLRGTLSSKQGFVKAAYVPGERMMFRRKPSLALAAYTDGLAHLEVDRGKIKMTFFAMPEIDFLVSTKRMLSGLLAVAGRSSNDKKAAAVAYNIVRENIFQDILNFWRDSVFGRQDWGRGDHFNKFSEQNFKFMNHANALAGDEIAFELYEEGINADTELLEAYEIEPDKLIFISGREMVVISDPPRSGPEAESVGVSSLHLNLNNVREYTLEYESADILRLTIKFINELSKMWYFRATRKSEVEEMMGVAGLKKAQA